MRTRLYCNNLPPKGTNIISSSCVNHAKLKKSLLTINDSFEFVCHTADGENDPYVIFEFPEESEIKKVYLVNRFKTYSKVDEVANKLIDVKFSISNDAITWEEIYVKISENEICKNYPIEISSKNCFRYLKAYKVGEGCSAIHFSQVLVNYFDLIVNSKATLEFSKKYKLKLDPAHGLFEGRNGLYASIYTSIDNDSDKVDTVVVKNLGRFGNAIIQLCNAISIAQKINAKNVKILDLEGMDKLFLKNKVFVCKGIRVSISNCFDTSENVLLGNFFYSNLQKNITNSKLSGVEEVASELSNFLIFDQTESFEPTTLVIHIRSGDIFSGKNVHPGYGQPPLSYYTLLLKKENPDNVVIVFEDNENPVIDELIYYCKKRSINVSSVSSSLRKDVEVLLKAKCLVAGFGTFVPIIASLSRHLEKVYFFDRKDYSFYDFKGIDLLVVKDKDGDYRRQVLSNNWVNSEEQRELMVNYNESSLIVDEV